MARHLEGSFQEALQALTPQASIEDLIGSLGRSLKAWDDAYSEVVHDSQTWPAKATEERLRIATRNEMRARGVELPELIRWKLRALIGFRSEEEN